MENLNTIDKKQLRKGMERSFFVSFVSSFLAFFFEPIIAGFIIFFAREVKNRDKSAFLITIFSSAIVFLLLNTIFWLASKDKSLKKGIIYGYIFLFFSVILASIIYGIFYLLLAGA